MNKGLIAVGVLIMCAVSSLSAQAPAGFEEFRKSLLNDFNNFKSRILEHYADFLAGEWHEYESLEPESKYSEPKIENMPVFDQLDVKEADTQEKEIAWLKNIDNHPKVNKDGDLNFKEPSLMSILRSGEGIYSMVSFSLPDGTTHADSVSEMAFGGDKLRNEGEIMTPEGLRKEYDGDIFGFYGMKFALPKVEFAVIDSITTTLDFSRQWERLVADSVADRLTPPILSLQKQTGISDYLMFEMIMAYLDHKLTGANDASKMSITHYLLAHMGFGVRIAIDDNDNPFILLPFTEKIFGKSMIPLGKDYYVFSTPGRAPIARKSLRSPYVPDNAEQGASMNLRMKGLNLPVKKCHYDISYAGLNLKGDLNENIFPLLYRYPQMDTGGFASTMISPDVRESVVNQLKEQLGGEDSLAAAEKLLEMIQFGFPYATDDKFHGFEKPYFFEEILYYPKSDCEDRAVFYSYLLWNVLGLENDLITYPGHEAAAIRAESVKGGFDHYLREGKKYYISDPTYQGAPTGQCMPQYSNLYPGIDLSYE